VRIHRPECNTADPPFARNGEPEAAAWRDVWAGKTICICVHVFDAGCRDAGIAVCADKGSDLRDIGITGRLSDEERLRHAEALMVAR
jgi:hypothetical protein